MSRALGLVPHLFVKDVDTSLSFYDKAFGAVELFRDVPGTPTTWCGARYSRAPG